MADKKVTNPLLNISVTGGTLEEFSQNALLLPAKEKPPTLLVPLQPDQTFGQNILNPISSSSSQSTNNLQQNFRNIDQSIDLNSQQSIFSSFSNIVNLENPTTESNNPLVSSFINPSPPPPPLNVEPVPLLDTTSFNSNSSLIRPPQGSLNNFRRKNTKKPIYAPIPGLTSNSSICIQPNLSQQQPVLSSQASLPNHFQNFPQQQTNYSPLLLEEFTPVTSTQDILQNPDILQQTNQINIFNPPDMSKNITMSDTNSSPTRENVYSSGRILPGQTVTNNTIYRPVYHHWFYKHDVEGKTQWRPFSMTDSLALDQTFTSNDLDPDKFVATDGGRFDVNILRRQRIPVYWKGNPTEVRRCSWFYKVHTDGRYVPYEENIATKLEEEYKIAFELKQWQRKIALSNGDVVLLHAPDIIELFPPSQSPDAWGNTQNQTRTRLVKRGMDEFDIDEGEPEKVDHILFMVHGIGSVCDLKFRTVEEVVDEFRKSSLQLIQSHYRSSCEKTIVNRIEVFPISWHNELHSEETGIDKTLESITLESIPRLRKFTNDTLLDILFYTSPVYCQTIISAVGNQLNKVYHLFKQRNPDFNGGVSLGGHSLGSLILFDLLCHQQPEENLLSVMDNDDDIITPLADKPDPKLRKISRRISYMMGRVGTGQPQLFYPHLDFQPSAFFALGSPIGMFVTVRGLDHLGEHFSLPTCPAFFNIFHPYDPVAYRIEYLINPELANVKPMLIPHHKGRKRLHLELKETMVRVGADLKQKVIDSMKNTWNTFYQLAMFHRPGQPTLEEEVDKALKEHLDKRKSMEEASEEQTEEPQTELSLGSLNKGRRIDYVLQEAPFEFFDYIFALTSHVCYWDSQDTILLMIKEIYSSMNISPDDKIPQQTMTIERSTSSNPNQLIGMNPTIPIHENLNIGPPPTSGFVKKT